MDDITRLFGLSFCMLVGCYVAGAIPLAFTMSEVRDHSLYCVLLLNEAVMSVKILVNLIKFSRDFLYTSQTTWCYIIKFVSEMVTPTRLLINKIS